MNSSVFFFEENGIGDACENDFDGDNVGEEDTCPFNKFVSTTNFKKGSYVLLSELDLHSQRFPRWTVRLNVGFFKSFQSIFTFLYSYFLFTINK